MQIKGEQLIAAKGTKQRKLNPLKEKEVLQNGFKTQKHRHYNIYIYIYIIMSSLHSQRIIIIVAVVLYYYYYLLY